MVEVGLGTDQLDWKRARRHGKSWVDWRGLGKQEDNLRCWRHLAYLERLGSREGDEGKKYVSFVTMGWEQRLWGWMEGRLGVPTAQLSSSQKKCEPRWSAVRMRRGEGERG